jgi:hypothetical protein
MLRESEPGAFRFDGTGVWWRNQLVSTDELRAARNTLALSFGSCSFDEPVADLRGLGLSLDPPSAQ